MSKVWLFIVLFVKTNPDFPDAVCAGVLLSNSVNALVRANDIRLQNDYGEFNAESRFYGVYKSNGYDNTICGNDVTGLNGYDRGIGSIMSPGLITCNKLEFTRAGLFFAGDNKKKDAISGNEISDAYAGIQVYSDPDFQTHIGEQDHQGNKWMNNWVYGGLWTGTDQTYLPFSKFLNNNQYPFSPNAQVSPSDWFEPDADANIFVACIENAGIDAIACNIITEGGEKLNSLASDKDKLVEPYRSMVLKKAYSQIISEYIGISMPFEYKSFINENSGLGFAKLAEIDFIISNPLANYPNLLKSISQKNDSIQVLIPEYLAYQKTLDNLSFGEHVLSLGQVSSNPTVGKINSLTAELGFLTHVSDSIRLEKWVKANILNDELIIENEFIDIEQKINKIYLNLLIDDQVSPNYNDSLFIKTVASYCPQQWGDAVFKSRSMWIQMGNSLEKSWDECFPTKVETVENRNFQQYSKRIEANLTSLLKPTAFPIPVSDNLIIYAPEEYLASSYEVFNAMGISVAKGILYEQYNQVETTLWSNGIYFINIKDKNKRPLTLKVVVQKL
jgi:hypothetical protein